MSLNPKLCVRKMNAKIKKLANRHTKRLPLKRRKRREREREARRESDPSDDRNAKRVQVEAPTAPASKLAAEVPPE